jgi:hypothetical protein
MKLQFHEAANAVVKFYGNVPRILEDPVFDVRVCDWFARKVLPSNTKHYIGL